ncbi:hypothetical protein L7F22_032717 [Adiantum nelumboides]|nr:hypothetical protein [Adiantum nelumboides]
MRVCEYAPFADRQAKQAPRLLLHNERGDGGGAPLFLQGDELSEEEIWDELSVMATSNRSDVHSLTKSRSTPAAVFARPGNEASDTVSCPSSPLHVPKSSCRSQVALQDKGTSEKELDCEDYMKASPHAICGGASKAKDVLAFSMLEGHGRTLKGRDLINVRNAVWQKIGFCG